MPKIIDKNLKHEVELIIKSKESLTENKIKNEIEQSLSKEKNGNDIHENGKQQNHRTAQIWSEIVTNTRLFE